MGSPLHATGEVSRGLAALASLIALGLLAGCSKTEASASDRPRGAALYAGVCARCHGADGSGGAPVANGAAPRKFRDRAFQESHSDADIMRVIAQGTPNGMPPFAPGFDESQIASLVAVVRGFAPETQKATPATTKGETR